MTTYPYTGVLRDFAEAPFPEAVPDLYVVPFQDAFGPSGGILAARRIPVALLPTGVFRVDLVASADLVPPTKYSLRCDWLDTDRNVRGWAQWDFTALIGGGDISNMTEGDVTNVWYSAQQPPVSRAGIFWIHPTTGDVREWV